MPMAETAPLRDPVFTNARDAYYARLSALFAGKPLDQAFFLQGVSGKPTADPYRDPEQALGEALRNLAQNAKALQDPVVFRPLCVVFDFYGVHFIDRIFGARVRQYEGQWWSELLARPVGRLEPPDLERNETWRTARTMAEAFVAQKVSVPIFTLPTIASALNIAVNLYSEEFLAALITEPDAALSDLRVVNDLLCRLHRWYLERIPLRQLQAVASTGRCQPPGFGQLCGCATHLLSAKMYGEFVAPLDDALLSVYPHGGMIHLCGAHTHHIPVWREMKSLRAVQVNDRAADDMEIYFKELRPDQIIYLCPSAKMTVERAMEITGGRRIVLVANSQRPVLVRACASG